MSSKNFARYIWLVNLLRQNKEGLSFAEISQHWIQNSLSDEGTVNLSLRTFHNHKDAIQEIFDITILCNTHNGNKYYIEDLERLEKDVVRTWLLNSFATFNVLKASPKMEDRIQFEEMPSAQRYLSVILEAMQHHCCLHVSHLGFGKAEATDFLIRPYGVKVCDRRWYLIGWSSAHEEVRTYALDRILTCLPTQESYEIPADFSLDEYFAGSCGISTQEVVTHVQLKVWDKARDYVQTLPLHSSQKEIGRNDAEGWIEFEYYVKPNINFIQKIFSQMDAIEVVSPTSLREQMKERVQHLLDLYQ